MSVKLLTEYHLEFLNLKGGCTGLFESTLVKRLHCWKAHAMAHIVFAVQEMKDKMWSQVEEVKSDGGTSILKALPVKLE